MFATACVLSYERPDFLRQSIETMIEHADWPLEIIVHDDGSKDPRVNALLQGLLAEGKVSTVMLNPPGHNEGQGIALNRMFHAAQGDPIIKLDQDLVYQPGWLAESVRTLEANRARMQDPNNPLEGEPAIGALGLFRYPAEPVRYEDMFVQHWGGEWEECKDFVGSAMVIPRDAWEAFGPFDHHSDAFAEDREFKMKLRAEGLALALPSGGDLVVNVGFGVGPSTVVVDHGTVAGINHGPHIIGGGA